jgi:hypothetical protein
MTNGTLRATRRYPANKLDAHWHIFAFAMGEKINGLVMMAYHRVFILCYADA